MKQLTRYVPVLLLLIVIADEANAFRLLTPCGARYAHSRPTWEADPRVGPFNLADSAVLRLDINGHTVEVTFLATDTTAQAVASRIQAAIDAQAPGQATVTVVGAGQGTGAVRIDAGDGGTVTVLDESTANGELRFSHDPHRVSTLDPHDRPPFVHWDMREFPDCTVPYSVYANAANTPLVAVKQILAVEEAFGNWESVTPALISFSRVDRDFAADSHYFKDDGWNVVSWYDLDVRGPSGMARFNINSRSGRIIEADIALNNRFPYWWVSSGQDWQNPWPGGWWDTDVEGVATHEIGHFIGLAHVPSTGSPADPTMSYERRVWGRAGPVPSTELRSLADDDEDGCNYLYNPDLGDAPDVDHDYSDVFSSLVHGPAAGRPLNSRQLDVIWPGPTHKFGIRRRQVARNWTYEWLGSDMDSECEARIVNLDNYDDGVTFNPYPPLCGQPMTITVTWDTDADNNGRVHDYGTYPMWINLWIDLNINKRWEESEHIIHESRTTPGSIQRTVIFPETDSTVWVRCRLDWGEDVGVADNIDGTLQWTEGAAQHGEVEDYPLGCRRPDVIELLPGPCYAEKWWTYGGEPLWEAGWIYSYRSEDMEIPEQATVWGILDFRNAHPEFEGQDVILSLFPPDDLVTPPTDWRQRIRTPWGTADVMGVSLFGPPWEYGPLGELPEVAWKVPALAPGPGEGVLQFDTIYTAVNLALYFDSNPVGFLEGAWNEGQTLSELGVEIINGMITGVNGISFATSEFMLDPVSPTGLVPSGGVSTYLNSSDYYTDIIIVESKGSIVPRFTCCVGITGNVDGDAEEIIDIGDVTALLDYLYIRPGVEPPECMPEANVDGDPGGIVDIGDVTALLDYLYIRPGVEPPAECP